MNEPTMLESINSAPDIVSLVSYIPIPGYGVLPVNAFVIKAREPVLVDTGMTSVRSDFMRNLRAAIDPKDLRWVWLTHIDMDHIGNLEAVLAEAEAKEQKDSIFIRIAKKFSGSNGTT